MTAAELRIGNYHFYHIEDSMDERKEWDDVCQIDYDDLRILIEFKDNSEYKPIPLTEEWLLKFGFVKGEYHTYDYEKLSICLKGNSYTNGITYFNSWCIIENQPEYVHQLQNIYFALTGEELIISQ